MNTTGKKHGGRTKGTPNKLTKELRGTLKNIMSNELEKLPEHFEQLKPKERVELLVKLMPYVVPQEKPENEENNEKVSINFNEPEPPEFSFNKLVKYVTTPKEQREEH